MNGEIDNFDFLSFPLSRWRNDITSGVRKQEDNEILHDLKMAMSYLKSEIF